MSAIKKMLQRKKEEPWCEQNATAPSNHTAKKKSKPRKTPKAPKLDKTPKSPKSPKSPKLLKPQAVQTAACANQESEQPSKKSRTVQVRNEPISLAVPQLQVDPSTQAAAHVLHKYTDLTGKQRAFVQMAMKMGGLQLTHSQSEELLSKLNTEAVPDLQETQLDVMQSMQRMSNMLTHSPCNNICTIKDTDLVSMRSNISMVRRAWEERFLHEPSGCERACVNKSSNTCFASLIENHGVVDPNFALCEFYTEQEYSKIEQSGWCWPENTKPCLLCLRNMIFHQLMQTRCNNSQVLSSVNYSPIGNLVGVKGEYCAENCFVSRPDRYEGLLVPVVIPNVMDYKVVTNGGIRYLQQLLPQPGNFRSNFFF